MIFKDIFNKKENSLSFEFELLFKTAKKNQVHSGDLLLVSENGFYDPKIRKGDTDKLKLSPYSIGITKEWFSLELHYNFIHNYWTTAISGKTYTDYILGLKSDNKQNKDLDDLKRIENMTIQLEMLIYLKIWECDAFIKKFVTVRVQ